MGMLVRVNEYRIQQVEGAKVPVQTGHGVRVVPANVTMVYTAGLGLEENLTTDHECFRVWLTDGRVVITDWAGISDINNWVQPS